MIDIVGPLGYGTFKYENFENLAIIGGGIGVFPLYELAKNAKNENKNVNIYLGFRNTRISRSKSKNSNVRKNRKCKCICSNSNNCI